MRLAAHLVVAAAALAIWAPASSAAVSVTSFSLTPASTQAGFNPDVSVDAQFSSTPATDSIRHLTLSLPTGLLASPAAAPACAPSDLQVDNCGRESLVGTGAVTATGYTLFGEFTFPSPARVYLVASQGPEVARLGMIANTPVGPVIFSAPVNIRTTPDVGIEATFLDLPNRVAGQTFAIRRIQLTLQGSAARGPFTRLPTACVPATTSLGIVAYDGSGASAQSTFTPTGCESLAFSPTGRARARLDATGAAAVEIAVRQASGQAAVRRLTPVLPPSLAPRLSAFQRVCAEPDANACPATATIGSATVVTPLLTQPLVGRLVLRARPGSPLPGLTIVFSPPLAIQLHGVPELGPRGLAVTFEGIPDVPISDLRVNIAGGRDSVFTGRALCTGSHAVLASLAAHSGAAADIRVPIAVSGCPAVPPSVTASTRGLGGSRARVTLRLRVPASAPALRTVNVHLPAGLGVRARGLARSLRVTAGGRRLRGAGGRRGNGLRIALPGPGSRNVTISLSRPGLRVSRTLARRVRRGSRPRLRFVVSVRDSRGGIASVHPRARARP